MKENRIISRVKRRWLINKLIALVFLIIPTLLLLIIVEGLFNISSIFLLISAVIVVIGYVNLLKPWPINYRQVIRYLEANYPWTENSLDLLDQNSSGLLEKLQKKRISTRLEERKLEIHVPGHPEATAFGIFLSVIGTFVLVSFDIKSPEKRQYLDQVNEQVFRLSDSTYIDQAPEIKNFEIIIEPPAYTQLASYSPEELSFELSYLSSVAWSFYFSKAVDKAFLSINGSNILSLTVNGEKSTGKLTIEKDILYQLHFFVDGEEYTSSFHSINVINDRAPQIELMSDQYLTLPGPDTLLEFDAIATDDYGLASASLITTVSSGDGEAVKFREQERKLPINVGQKEWGQKIVIDPRSLEMTYGDELYFYIMVSDNKPIANKTKSSTFIIQIPDTSQVTSITAGGMAADLMPEYFRSQRQIIIDSEKLLKEKQSINKEEFNERSNTLAHDQKSLRLRYGQFIGLEDDSGIATGVAAEVEQEANVEAYSHDHDHEEAHEAEAYEEGDEENEEDPLDEFMHSHDSEEEATFLYQSTKAKLKAALAVMWDAELHLRLYDPKSSLPYQYKALKLIKEVQRNARIYVQRIGFEPPPIKESNRLTGELDEVKDVQYAVMAPDKDILGVFIQHLDTLITTGMANKNFSFNLKSVQSLMADKAQQDPVAYLDVLESLRRLQSDISIPSAKAARRELSKIRKEQSIKAEPLTDTSEPWNSQFIKSLIER